MSGRKFQEVLKALGNSRSKSPQSPVPAKTVSPSKTGQLSPTPTPVNKPAPVTQRKLERVIQEIKNKKTSPPAPTKPKQQTASKKDYFKKIIASKIHENKQKTIGRQR